MAYRTLDQAKSYFKTQQRNLRTSTERCVLLRDAYGNPRGFLHRGKAVAYSPRRGSLAPTILDGLINGEYKDAAVDGKLRLIKMVRYERQNGTVKGYDWA